MLDEKISAMLSLISCGYFLKDKMSKLKVLCENLMESMIKYVAEMNKKSEERIISLNDQNFLQTVNVCVEEEINSNYRLLNESLKHLITLNHFSCWISCLQTPTRDRNGYQV